MALQQLRTSISDGLQERAIISLPGERLFLSERDAPNSSEHLFFNIGRTNACRRTSAFPYIDPLKGGICTDFSPAKNGRGILGGYTHEMPFLLGPNIRNLTGRQ